MKVSESKPGKINSAKESSGADGTARRTVVTGGGGTDINMYGEKDPKEDVKDKAFTAVRVFAMDSITKAALDSEIQDVQNNK